MESETCILRNVIMAKHLMRLEGISETLFKLSQDVDNVTSAELLFLADCLKASGEVLMNECITTN